MVAVGQDPSLQSPASGTKRCESCLMCCTNHSSEWGPGAGLSERCSNTLTIPFQSLTKVILDSSELKGPAECYTYYHRCPHLWKLDRSENRVLMVRQCVHEYSAQKALVPARRTLSELSRMYGVCLHNGPDRGSPNTRGKVSPRRTMCRIKEDRRESGGEERSVGHSMTAEQPRDSRGTAGGAAKGQPRQFG
jgi:hypothetical protein